MFDPRPDHGRPDAGLLAAVRAELTAPGVEFGRLSERLLAVERLAAGADVQAGGLAIGTPHVVPDQLLADLAARFPGHVVTRHPDGSVTVGPARDVEHGLAQLGSDLGETLDQLDRERDEVDRLQVGRRACFVEPALWLEVNVTSVDDAVSRLKTAKAVSASLKGAP